MEKIQKTYTAEFKREAVRLAQISGKPIAQVAREWAFPIRLTMPTEGCMAARACILNCKRRGSDVRASG